MQIVGNALFQVDGSDFVSGPITLDQPVGTLPIVDDARWSSALTGNSWMAILVWIALLVVLQAVLWPVVRQVFKRFPDRGWGFSRIFSLLVSAYGVWLLASLEAISFRAIWAGSSVVIVAALAWGLGLWLDSRYPPTLSEPWYRNRFILATEGVFWLVFLLFLLYRFINPDSYHLSWGGEKPMEFAHLNAILRSAHFPPYDPWYADGTLNYYYYGMYLMAFLFKLTGIPTEIAFNLAQPMVMAMLASGAFSLSMAVARSVTRRRLFTFAGGLAGLLLVSFAGNMVAASRFVSGLANEMDSFHDYGYWFWGPTRIVSYTINEFPYFTGLYADLHAHVVALPITVLIAALCFALISNARGLALALFRPKSNSMNTVTITVTLLALALSVGTLYATNAWDVPAYVALIAVSVLVATRSINRLPLRLVVSGVLVAGIGAVAYFSILPFVTHYVSLYGEIETVRSVTEPVQAMAHFGGFFLILTLGLIFLNARDWPSSAPRGLAPAFALVLSAALLFRLWAVNETGSSRSLADALIVLVVVGVLAMSVILARPRDLDFGLPVWGSQGLMFVVWLAVVLIAFSGRSTLGLFLAIAATAAVMWLRRAPFAERFVLSLVAASMSIGAAMEVVFLVDGLSGGDSYRMNSVFKFYNQTWIMAALASGALIAMMARTAFAAAAIRVANGSAKSGVDHMDEIDDSPSPELGADPQLKPWAMLGTAVTAVVIIASLAYPVIATPARLEQRFQQDGASPTLNALDWMNYGLYPDAGGSGRMFSFAEDRDVIDWFNTEVPGTPVIAEASLNNYACSGSRIAIHTGLPVVLGWWWHEQQQRGPSDIQTRQADLRMLYTSSSVDEKRSILSRYRVDYVVVGSLERNYPSGSCEATDNTAGLAALESMVGTDLEVAFTSGETVVYRVVRAKT